MSTEDEIRSSVAEIKAKLEAAGTFGRKSFSTAVAQELFNRGLRPSGGMVLGYTSLGSTQDVIKDVNEFWAELKDKLEGAMAVPVEFRDIATKLVMELWNEAQSQAGNEFEALKQEYIAELAVKDTELEVAVLAAQELSQKLEDTHVALEAKEVAFNQLASANEGLSSECATLRENVSNLNKLIEDERMARKADSDAFMAALDKERNDRGLSEARLKEEKNYAMMEIDKARQETKAIEALMDKKIGELNNSVSMYRQQVNAAKENSGRLSMELEHHKGLVEGMESELLMASSRNQELIALLAAFAKLEQANNVVSDALIKGKDEAKEGE